MTVLDSLREQARRFGQRLQSVQGRIANVRIALEHGWTVRTGRPDEIDRLGDMRQVKNVARCAHSETASARTSSRMA